MKNDEMAEELAGFNMAHTRIHSRADELIACLEVEIAKRDEELAACRVSVENCEVFRARIAELEARIVWLECEAQVNAAPVSEVKAHGVVMPEGWIPLTIEHEPGYPEDVAFGPKRVMDRLKKLLDRYFEMRLNAAPAAPAADAGLVDALGYQVLFDAIAAATSVYANGAVNISVQAFRDALAAHSAKGVV